MSDPWDAADWDADVGQCITCSDQGVLMRVVAAGQATARCIGPQGSSESVATELVGPVTIGDQVLVHAGVAIRLLGAKA
jgi:hydrogenase maturation factor